MSKLKDFDHKIFSVEPGVKANPKTIGQAPFDTLVSSIGDYQASFRLTFAFARLRLYLQAAATQNKRIWRAYRESKKAARLGDRRKAWHWLNVASVECHFYFTCWDCVRKILSALAAKRSGFSAPVEVWKKHSAIFKNYKIIRDHLEHYDERLPGGSRTDFIQDELGLEGTLPGVSGEGFFFYQHKLWDVRPGSVRLLHSIISELETTLRPELETSVRRHLELRTARMNSTDEEGNRQTATS